MFNDLFSYFIYSNDRKEVSNCLLKALKYIKKGEVLDIGSSYGINSIYLAEKGFNVTALDFNAYAINELKRRILEKRLNMNFKVGNILNYNYDKKYDFIIACAVLYFLESKEEIFKVINDMKKNTKFNGINVIATFLEDKKNIIPSNEFKTFLKGREDLFKIYSQDSNFEVLYYNEKELNSNLKKVGVLIARRKN